LLLLHQSRAVTTKNLTKDKKTFAPQHASTLIKVIHIINDLSIGGAETMLYKLLAETDRDRFEPIVISLIDRGALRQRIEELGIAVHTTRMEPGLPSPLGLWRLVRLMRQLKPDLVLGWMYHSCLAAQLANFFLPRRVPVLWSIHYSITSLASEKKLTAVVIRVCALLSRLAAHLIFVSRASQAQHRRLGYRLDDSCVIPNGINVEEFVSSGGSRSSVRSELGLSDDALLIGLVGRYHPVKDHANFLKAAALISKEYPATNFLLVGRGVDQDNPVLRRLIQALGLAREAHLLGERSDMPRLAAALDVFSLTSAYGESFPNVIGEAMACEVPCVVTDVGDVVWIVGNAGRVVPPRDSRALADAWKEMIDLGPAGRRALGRDARSRVIERFPLEAVVARYEALYETVLAREAPEDFALTTPALTSISNLSTSFDDTGVG